MFLLVDSYGSYCQDLCKWPGSLAQGSIQAREPRAVFKDTCDWITLSHIALCGLSLRVRGLFTSHDEWSSGCLSIVSASSSESSRCNNLPSASLLYTELVWEKRICMGRKSDRLHIIPSGKGNRTPDAGEVLYFTEPTDTLNWH